MQFLLWHAQRFGEETAVTRTSLSSVKSKLLASHKETQASNKASKLNGSQQLIAKRRNSFPSKARTSKFSAQWTIKAYVLWGGKREPARRLRETADVRALEKSHKSQEDLTSSSSSPH